MRMADVPDSLTAFRRDLHAHAEAGWKEFRTTALVAAEMDALGFELSLGSDAVAVEERLGVPSDAELAAAQRRAREEGAPTAYLDRMDGVTGLVATKRYGDGPTIGVRVDMDALAREEAADDDHRPAREGFASRHPGEMHACAHDGHTAIGVGIARRLDDSGFDGTLKLFFQPAEEGGRGGYPMSRTSHLDDVAYLFALHLGLDEPTGTIIASYDRPLANTKLDVRFRGEPAHAGGAPQAGRNALQALATAVTNLYAIPRHADGTTRVNVGMVEADNAQNVIAEDARMRVEVRGETSALDEYMQAAAERIVDAAAQMHDVSVETSRYGQTTSFEGDAELAAHVATAAGTVGAVDTVTEQKAFGGSEDASYLIRRVQEAGGQAVYVGIGASNVAGHHTAYFDIDEESLAIGADVLAATVRRLAAEG